ncbi:MAG TPA: EAL domain-containing protein [Methylophilaceae bacterium]|jgi:diguanylate cyclase (GGDEF)-like protein
MTHVLIVDDKEENLYYLEALLTGNGCTVDSARHGAEALVKARQTPPDVIISDLLMPVMDGYTLLRHWKLDSVLKHIPFIVYTATYTEPEDEQLAISLGADAFILKPAEPEDFINKLHEVQNKAAVEIPQHPAQPNSSEKALLKVYSETLIRKLEEKTLQLEAANRELQLDITRRKEAEDKIEHLAFYDPLTGLPNRRLMQDRLQHSFAGGSRHQLYGALLFIDLDNFKTLNDTKGHNFGDHLLIMVAERLQSCVREGDTVARLGGDEFVVILENLSENAEQAATLAESVGDKILVAIDQPYLLQTEDYHCTASIGISLFRDQEITVDELLRRADTAMYQAKSYGRNTLRFYDPAMQAALEARMQLENDLRRAMAESQFKLYYQAQVNQQGEIFGAEALIRWLSPQKGMISPMEFIPLAEETGLILSIGNWVMETACDQLKAWEDDPQTSKLQLAVNVSARQFHQPDFIEQVLKILIDKNINPSRLKLELTESLVLDDIDAAITKMNVLKEAGLCFSMDDFGTGYSSLSYLTQLPLKQLKIDQSFVRNIGVKHVNAVIVQTIIGMAKNLDIEVIAEGVETEEQYKFLKEHECNLFQGYLFGKPVPIEEFEAIIKKPVPHSATEC